jgi:hypothetical protein
MRFPQVPLGFPRTLGLPRWTFALTAFPIVRLCINFHLELKIASRMVLSIFVTSLIERITVDWCPYTWLYWKAHV